MYPNEENVFIVANDKKSRGYCENLTLAQLTEKLWFLGKWQKEKLFLANQSIKTMYPNVENVFIVPNHKKNGDCYECLRLSYLMDEL